MTAAFFARYNINEQSIVEKREYYKCIKHIKENCSVLKENHVNSLLKTCKLLVIHGQDTFQIKNAKSCVRKVK